MRGLWPCGLLFRWSVRSVRARAAEKAGEGLRGAAGAPCGEGRGRARRGWSGRGSSPARRSAWGHTLRDVEAPREPTGGPRPPGPQAGTRKGRMLPAIEWASSEGRDRAAAGLSPQPCCTATIRPHNLCCCSSGAGGSRAFLRRSLPLVNCRILGWAAIRHSTHPNLRKVELLARSSSPALLAFICLSGS